MNNFMSKGKKSIQGGTNTAIKDRQTQREQQQRSKHTCLSFQFYSWKVDTRFPSRMTWNNQEIISMTKSYIFEERFHSRRRAELSSQETRDASYTEDVELTFLTGLC